MQADHIALFEQGVLVGDGVNSGCLDDISGAESIVGINIHAEAFGNASDVAANVSESQNA